jgi:hydrogenase-4 component F
LLLNVALYAVVRCGAGGRLVQTSLAREPMMDLRSPVGRRRRVPAVAAEGHQAAVRVFVHRAHAIITFAFGMGGPIANFAGLLHMTVHSLTKSAIFFTVGHATQKTGTQIMDIRGLITTSPMLDGD